MAFELEKRLTRLSDVEDADTVAVLGKGGQEVGVVRGGGEAEEWGCVGHSLLSSCRRHVSGTIGCWWNVSVFGVIRIWERRRRRHTFVDFLARLVDDGTMFEASEIEHANATIRAAGDEYIDTVGAEADVEDFFVVSDELCFGGKSRDVPYGACGIDAGGDDEAGGERVPVQRSQGCGVFGGFGV